MTRIGLRARLVRITVLAAFAAMTVLVVGLQVLLAHQSRQESLDALASRADAAASTVRVEGGRVQVLDPPADSLDQNIWIYAADGHRIDGSPLPPAIREVVDRLGRSGSEHTSDVRGSYRLLARPVNSGGGQRAVVVAGLDLTPYETSERRGLVLSLGLGLLTVLAAGAAAWTASGYALRQVRRMAHRADEWREHDLTGRFALGAPRDELTELADTLDRMLDRIASAILTERRLTDEVAHELRTPLSVIRSEAQLAQLEARSADSPRPQPDETLTAILSATDRMTASIETMLAVARSANAEEQHCHPADVLDHVRDHVVLREGVRVDVDDDHPETFIAAPLGVIAAAVAPLLDNALRHAEHRVHVHVRTQAHRVELHVEDDGDGVHVDRREEIFEPGHSSVDGAGLGLALTRRLVHSVGGEVQETGNGHGHFVLSLPRD